MLIKIFDKWVNPNNITKIESGYWISIASGYTECGSNGATVYFKGFDPIVFKDKTPDEVATEINKQLKDK